LKAGFRAAGAAILLLAVAAPAQDEGRPKIFLEKKVFADTSEGKKSYYEVHTVSEGENLWKILSRRHSLFRSEYAQLLKEFLRANPKVTAPGKLKPGQKILLPSASSRSGSGFSRGSWFRTRGRGDNLTKILKKQGFATTFHGTWRR
jgi:LysM repeat protein